MDKIKTWYTVNNNGDLGCHDCDYITALENLRINQAAHPDEEWEMFKDEK